MTKRKGFTLVELIVSIVIFSLVLGIIWSFFMYNLRLFNLSEANAQVQFQTRQASDYLINELQFVRAVSITDDTLPHQVNQAILAAEHPVIETISFVLIPSTTSYLLKIGLTGSNGNPDNDYYLETTITLKNVTVADSGSADTLYYDS